MATTKKSPKAADISGNPKKFLAEFRDFISRGNVLDLAIGVIIGGAFGKIVTSLVEDVIMPPIGVLMGGVNFTDFKWEMVRASVDETGKVIPAVSLNYGRFGQNLFNFLIIALTVFVAIKVMVTLKSRVLKKEEEEAKAEKKKDAEELKVLKEIRDLLKKA
ncbi:large conductance mechanosensitive channel protein MscL [Candidatus Gracilibacteria bacterium CG17_big_fil_post_rev_8_21_14_2_50_48_13]|nr:MAG: large conductance mechanosensitive channel protein MscL [Candidatus Gracilibacteria bacterium CG17_big_fil_post_rev_8_21_14_2_50_48_13]